MKLSSPMPKYGLIGCPLEGSLSPLLFDAAYGGRWDYNLVEEQSFERAWSRFIDEFEAVNVTAPFKEEAFRRADIPSDECLLAGAANILVKAIDGVHAYNSDYQGVRMLLSNLRLSPGGTALIVGYGGAGKAAAAASLSLGIEPVICNRTTSRAPGLHPLSDIPALAENADVLIYTLSCPIVELSGLYCHIVLDVNYRNQFLRETIDYDRYLSGRDWLLAQAVTGYHLMTGESPDFSAMMAVSNF